jgi:hypothetical protein
MVVVTVLNVVPICEPSPRAAAMMPTAISAAIRPYSMAVAPDSSFAKRTTNFVMITPSRASTVALSDATFAPSTNDVSSAAKNQLEKARLI